VKSKWMFLALLLASATAGAQMYKWVDKDGKVRYGDTPPPGAKTSSIAAPAPAAAPPAAKDAKGAKDAKQGPQTPAEREQEYRKRQADNAKAAEKAEAEARDKVNRTGDCERAREHLRTLQSGQRIARTDSKGERVYLEDAQIAQEITEAQQSLQKLCK
jgi:hypothetical protein